MTSPVLVTGGTGRLGKLVVAQLADDGCAVRVLARHHRPVLPGVEFFPADLRTGQGVEPAVTGAAAIIHCATSTRGDAQATRNLVAAAARAGSAHLLYVSIVGIDRIATWGYPKAKLEAEQIVAGSGLPWTILRVTQFYDYCLANARKLSRLPVAPVPAGFIVQPVDPRDVAVRLAELARGRPAGRAADLAGPQVTNWTELLRGYLTASHRRRLVVPLRIPGTRAVRDGALLPPPGHTAGARTWEQFLVSQLGAAPKPRLSPA
ncbi:MAG: NAD(P)H-binding protein [Actinobacteria bacterium]|nr:NAD(P)H-binding protein [Actinomycetota bacterium]